MDYFTTFSDVELERVKKAYTEKRDEKLMLMIFDEDLDWLDNKIVEIEREEKRREKMRDGK